MELEAKDINDAVGQIEFFRKYKPYEYGGKWLLAEIENVWFAFRTKKPLRSRSIKAGQTVLKIYTYGKN